MTRSRYSFRSSYPGDHPDLTELMSAAVGEFEDGEQYQCRPQHSSAALRACDSSWTD
jgi:hypothetical protein